MRASGFGLSILLVAVGAVLAWAVDVQTEGVDLNTVGVILFVVGLIGALVTMVLSAFGDRTVVERDREVVVDRERV